MDQSKKKARRARQPQVSRFLPFSACPLCTNLPNEVKVDYEENQSLPPETEQFKAIGELLQCPQCGTCYKRSRSCDRYDQDPGHHIDYRARTSPAELMNWLKTRGAPGEEYEVLPGVCQAILQDSRNNLHHDNKNIRAYAALALTEQYLNDRQWDQVDQLLRDEVIFKDVRFAVSTCRDASVTVPYLIRTLSVGDRFLAEMAALSLSRAALLGKDIAPALTALAQASGHPDGKVRSHAIHALCYFLQCCWKRGKEMKLVFSALLEVLSREESHYDLCCVRSTIDDLVRSQTRARSIVRSLLKEQQNWEQHPCFKQVEAYCEYGDFYELMDATADSIPWCVSMLSSENQNVVGHAQWLLRSFAEMSYENAAMVMNHIREAGLNENQWPVLSIIAACNGVKRP